MLHTRTSTEYRAGAAAAIVPLAGGVDTRAEESNERRLRFAAERALDEVPAESEVLEGSRPIADRTFLQGLVSLVGAIGIALLVPLAILLIGLPLALAVRGVVEAIGWLFGVSLI